MAHEINYNDNYGETRKNGKRAWHGLGDEIEEGLSAVEGFKQIGLGWETIMAPLTANIDVMGEDGPSTIQVPLLGKGDNGSTPMAHMRADDKTLLGIVTSGYRPMENMDLARFADALSGVDGGVQIETGGSLHNGRRVFALVKLPEVVKATSEDVMDQYILVQNGHGGFAAFSCYPTSVRVVCANTLRWSERDIAKGLKFRHSGDWDDKVAQARVALGVARQETERFQEQVTALVDTRLDGKDLEVFMGRVYDKCFYGGRELIKTAAMEQDTFDKLILKKNEIMNKWTDNLHNERQMLTGIRGSAWAAYNAISEYHDHERGRFGGIDESNARVSSNVFGVSQGHKSVAFRQALALVK